MEVTEETNFDRDRDMDNEKRGLKKMEVIQFYNYSQKSIQKKLKHYIKFLPIAILILIILIYIIYLIFRPSTLDKDYQLATFGKKIKKEEPKKEIIKVKPKETPKIIPKKPGIGFIYPTLTEFMVTYGEYFLNLKAYSVYYLTKIPSDKDMKFSNNITRLYVYYKRRNVEKIIKEENINYIIINDNFPEAEIKWLKTLGVKIIGIFDDVYASRTEKSSRNMKNIPLYDAFIQDSFEDYSSFKKLNINRNIFIPNIYDTTKIKLSSLNNHNIIILGRLNDDKKSIISVINAMASVVKEVADTKLRIISPDGQTLAINQLIKKLELNKNIFFVPFDTRISYYCIDSSIFIYASLITDCAYAIKESMDHGIPSLVSFDIPRDPLIQDGIINIDISKEKELAAEITKLLKDNKYKNKKGIAAKSSLEKMNQDALNIWEKLFTTLKNSEKDFQKLRTDVEIKYTLKEAPKKSIEKNQIVETKKKVEDAKTAAPVVKKEHTKIIQEIPVKKKKTQEEKISHKKLLRQKSKK